MSAVEESLVDVVMSEYPATGSSGSSVGISAVYFINNVDNRTLPCGTQLCNGHVGDEYYHQILWFPLWCSNFGLVKTSQPLITPIAHWYT